jgi:hypothetical protein
MLHNFISFISFNPANIASLMTFEMLQYQVNVVPNNGYAITELAVLLEKILNNSGILCIAQVDGGGYINGILVNNILQTLDPNLITPFCSIFLG